MFGHDDRLHQARMAKKREEIAAGAQEWRETVACRYGLHLVGQAMDALAKMPQYFATADENRLDPVKVNQHARDAVSGAADMLYRAASAFGLGHVLSDPQIKDVVELEAMLRIAAEDRVPREQHQAKDFVAKG